MALAVSGKSCSKRDLVDFGSRGDVLGLLEGDEFLQAEDALVGDGSLGADSLGGAFVGETASIVLVVALKVSFPIGAGSLESSLICTYRPPLSEM